jgi:hypothetical protein
MDPIKTFAECSAIIDLRGNDYGGIEDNFRKIASIASLSTGREITAYEVAMVLVATKLARMSGARDKRDNYLDAINYLVFALEMKDGTAGTAGCDGSSFDAANGRGK